MTYRILIVDDSFLMRALLKDIVESDPDLSVVDCAENGRVGLDKVRQHKPDLILLDIEMPDMSGIDMLKRLRLIGDTPVVVVSSVAQVGSPQAQEARRLGALDVIAKPSGVPGLDLKDKRGDAIVLAIRRAFSRASAPDASNT